MTRVDSQSRAEAPEAFDHYAFVYDGVADFVEGCVEFVRAGLAARDPVMVATSVDRIDRLRAALGSDGASVTYVDMVGVGRNPATIIPAWQDFVTTHARPWRHLRGIGEPAWAGRSDAELAECEIHEALLNVAFDDGIGWTLMCPYDGRALGRAVLDGAAHTHRSITHGDGRQRGSYESLTDGYPFRDAL